MNRMNLGRATVFALTMLAVILASNPTSTAYAQAPAKKAATPPPPPPDDPLVRVEAALDKLDKRLAAVEGDVATLKKDVASLKGDKANADKKAKDLATRVTKVESRVETLEKRPPLTIREYTTVYKASPPTYIYVREPGLLTRSCYSYVDGKLHIYMTSSSNWCLVTK